MCIRFEGRWVDKVKSVRTILYSTNKPTRLSENNCLPIFNIFELLQISVFTEDRIEI